MPKKFVGENSKAVVARARKAAAKEAENIKKKTEIEESYWKDNDKQIAKKQQRKEEQEQKRLEQLKKKQEAKLLLEQEETSIKTTGKQPLAKLTRAQIQAETEKRNAAAQALQVKKSPTHIEQPLEENINRLTIEGEIASTIEEAISILNTPKNAEDKHPEKRLKAAYAAFEEQMMPIVKAENPSLRLSQLKQLIWKEWLKSPENPLNQKSNP